MRKIVLLFSFLALFGILSLGFGAFCFAATTPTPTTKVTPSPSSTPSSTPSAGLDAQINDLKERIASRVAQLNLVEKRGVIGTVTDVTETQLTITDLQGNNRFIDVDELTKFSSPSVKGTVGISDITKGSTIGAIGLYNKDSRKLLARFINVLTLPQIISAAVTAIDGDQYTITITTLDQKDILVDIGTVTKTYTYDDSAKTLVKSGFSKIKQGERVMVIGFWDTKKSNVLIASRVILFPTLTVNPKIAIFKPGEFNITPSTGSGTKLVPIIKK